ncbi:unnamed protein product [Alternaria alternata]
MGVTASWHLDQALAEAGHVLAEELVKNRALHLQKTEQSEHRSFQMLSMKKPGSQEWRSLLKIRKDGKFKIMRSTLFKIVDPLAERKIPYAAIFGNHDDEGTLSRHAQMDLYDFLPYSVSEPGPNTIDGVRDYLSSIHTLTHQTRPTTVTLTPNKPNQIDWFKTTAQGLKEAHSHYTHKHLNKAFIHIPLPEYGNVENERVGNWTEPITAPAFNTHFKDALVEYDISAVSCGHDHVNDYCSLSKELETGDPDLWMCYAGGSGFGGYERYNNYHRRLRVFEIDANQARIVTWKRLEYGDTGKRLDTQIIVDSGRVMGRQSANDA